MYSNVFSLKPENIRLTFKHDKENQKNLMKDINEKTFMIIFAGFINFYMSRLAKEHQLIAARLASECRMRDKYFSV